MSMWRRAMLYLGLGPDEDYEYDDSGYDAMYDQPGDVVAPARGPSRRTSYAPDATGPSPALGTVRPLSREEYTGPSVPAGPGPGGEMRGSGTVRPVAAPVSAKPFTVSPDSFNEVQQIADRFMGRTPVIMNLQGVERDLSRRFVDFASGLCYGLSGHMERVTSQVYLLTPSNVEVSSEDRRHLADADAHDRQL